MDGCRRGADGGGPVPDRRRAGWGSYFFPFLLFLAFLAFLLFLVMSVTRFHLGRSTKC